MAPDNEIDWTGTRNLANHPDGLVRSILGYAGESLVIGRALACGYNLFFKAWRDSKYDAVLDAEGNLFRVEIKQTGSGTSISSTSGGRSGAQISREADSREEVLSPDDSDFLIGIHTFSGKCWIVPTEVIHVRGKKANPTYSLEVFEEKWGIFAKPPLGFSLNDIKIGFRKFNVEELKEIANRIEISESPNLRYKFSSRSKYVDLLSDREWYILEIWNKIFSAI